jgi:hypothetical protein
MAIGMEFNDGRGSRERGPRPSFFLRVVGRGRRSVLGEHPTGGPPQRLSRTPVEPPRDSRDQSSIIPVIEAPPGPARRVCGCTGAYLTPKSPHTPYLQYASDLQNRECTYGDLGPNSRHKSGFAFTLKLYADFRNRSLRPACSRQSGTLCAIGVNMRAAGTSRNGPFSAIQDGFPPRSGPVRKAVTGRAVEGETAGDPTTRLSLSA